MDASCWIAGHTSRLDCWAYRQVSVAQAAQRHTRQLPRANTYLIPGIIFVVREITLTFLCIIPQVITSLLTLLPRCSGASGGGRWRAKQIGGTAKGVADQVDVKLLHILDHILNIRLRAV